MSFVWCVCNSSQVSVWLGTAVWSVQWVMGNAVHEGTLCVVQESIRWKGNQIRDNMYVNLHVKLTCTWSPEQLFCYMSLLLLAASSLYRVLCICSVQNHRLMEARNRPELIPTVQCCQSRLTHLWPILYYLPLKQWVVQFDNKKCYLLNYILLMSEPITTINWPIQ